MSKTSRTVLSLPYLPSISNGLFEAAHPFVPFLGSRISATHLYAEIKAYVTAKTFEGVLKSITATDRLEVERLSVVYVPCEFENVESPD